MRSILTRFVAVAVVALFQVTEWRLGGTPGVGYTLAASGSGTTRDGATITLRSDSAPVSATANASTSVPADTLRGRRLRLIADIETKDAAGGASPWLRVDGPNGMISLDNGSDNRTRGTSAGRREVTLFVPVEATRVVFGLLITGRGEVTARGLHIEAGPVIAANAPLSPVATRELDSAIALVRQGSLWRDTVTWDKVLPGIRAIAAGSATTADVYPAISALLARLGDHHSFLMRPQGTRQFQSGGAENPRPVIKALPDRIGYIAVPAYSGIEPNAMRDYVQFVHDSVGRVLAATGCKWIVDLRGNGGGNMWPMLGGLRPFFGEAGLGSFVSNRGSAPLWHAKDVVDIRPTAALAALDSAYVAVMTGPRTASSGEAVTISFRGRPHTRSFGLPTAGLSTANATLMLPDSAMILLTTSVEADRTGRRYGEKIDPDEVVPAGAAGSAEDAQLAAAVAWLKTQPSCARPRG